MRIYKRLNFILALILLSVSIFAFNQHNCCCDMEMDEVSLSKTNCNAEAEFSANAKFSAGDYSQDNCFGNYSFVNNQYLQCKQFFVLDFSTEVEIAMLRSDKLVSFFSAFYLEENLTEPNLCEKFYYLSSRTNHNYNSYYLAENLSDRAPPVLFV
ncbi:MAG: hypothetical protein K9N07_04070 [Candidatus Cloacimonetes bacterium]|nr:hypothetical protein [Candidatus Cloacimonadota bacterium]